MPLWRKTRAQHPQCFFCSHLQTQLERSTSVQRFVCSTCGSYNALTPDGAPADDERPAVHWDATIPSNALSLSKRGTPNGKRAGSSSSTIHKDAPAQEEDSFFCSQCRRHQSLHLYLLGAYYDNTEEDSAEDTTLSSRLDEYRESLDSRYPPLCAACEPAVAQELNKRNIRARADILNQSIINNNSARRSHDNASPRHRRRDPRATLQWRSQTFIWRIKGCLWALVQLCSLICYFYAAFKPTLVLDLRQHPWFSFVLCPALFSFFISFWQPLWNRRREKAAASPDPRRVVLHGHAFWLTACFFAFACRCAYVIVLVYVDMTPAALQRTSLSAASSSVLLLCYANSRQRVAVQTSPQQQTKASQRRNPSSSPESKPMKSIHPAREPQEEPTAGPHPLFGDWQALQRQTVQSSSSAPMDVDEAVEWGTAGQNRTPLEQLLAGTGLQHQGPFS